MRAGLAATGPRRALVGLLRPALALAILALLFSRVPGEALLAAFAQVRPAPLAQAALVALGTHLLVALRLQGLVAAFGTRIATGEIVLLSLGALFYGLFLPAGNLTGVLVRYVGIARRDGNYAGAGVALLLDRLVATVTLCAVGVAFGLLDGRPASRVALVPLAAGLALLPALVATALHPGAARHVLARLPSRLTGRLAPLQDALRLARTLPRKVIAIALVLGIASHLLGTMAYGLIAQAQGFDLGPLGPGWIRAAALFAAILPVSVVGLGPREGMTVLLTGRLGIGAPAALAFALLAYGTTVLLPALLGGALEALRLLVPGRGRGDRA